MIGIIRTGSTTRSSPALPWMIPARRSSPTVRVTTSRAEPIEAASSPLDQAWDRRATGEIGDGAGREQNGPRPEEEMLARFGAEWWAGRDLNPHSFRGWFTAT